MWIKKNETNNGFPFFIFKCDKRQLTFDKPFYLGFIVSEISKLQMLELYYDILQTHYGEEKLILHYTDTDSIIYTPQPKTGTIVGDLKDLQEKYN